MSTQEKEKIELLAIDFRGLWSSDTTSGKDRQDLVRILIEKIVVEVVDGTKQLSVTIHWSVGYKSHHETRRTVSAFDQLSSAISLFERTQRLYNLGYPRKDIVSMLNDEGFHPARQASFTLSNINALFLVIRRKGMIDSRPKLPAGFWKSSDLSKAIGIDPATLTGWRHQSWVQAKQAGSRWIYWASDAEIDRLRKLAQHPKAGFEPTPKELIDYTEIMPGN